MAGGSMILTSLKTLVEPIFNDAFLGLYEQRRNETKKIFMEKPGLKRSSHVQSFVYGFKNAPYIGDGAPLEFDQGGTQYTIFYPYDEIALGFGISERAIEDSDWIDLAGAFSRHLDQSMFETDEILGANILNEGFNGARIQQGGDGLPLFSTVHPLAVGGTYSNYLTAADLSMTSLEDAVVQIAQMVDARGKKVAIRPRLLVVPPALMTRAPVVLKSILNPDATTASNAVNPINSENYFPDGFQVVTRLTSDTAYFITTDLNAKGDMGLVKFNRRVLRRETNTDFNTNSIQRKASMRFRYGWVDPRGCFANPGA